LARPGIRLLTLQVILAIASHGILDGLKHGYPIAPGPDICLGLLLAVVWTIAVRRPLVPLFALSFLGVFLPDVVDHAPGMALREIGLPTSSLPKHVFPWHFGEGSGSLFPGSAKPGQDLNRGRSQEVSYTNHAIVLLFSLAGILTAPWALRFVPLRARDTDPVPPVEDRLRWAAPRIT
jgi:hypothetical protein